ncbi:hypothetical protein ACF064_09440 [Streptomyces sp. NPDC015492]|uniref:hypothetical protein n=1 Tax=Streptomyces sp. NPDC015492 TaxID=3364958 RepID=UPI0036F599B8
MGDEEPHTTRDPRSEHGCPVCGQPRTVTAARHKVLGAWVPEWEVQPCRNPDCTLHRGAEADLAGGARTPADVAAGTRPAGADAASAHVTGKNGKSGETGRSQATG